MVASSNQATETVQFPRVSAPIETSTLLRVARPFATGFKVGLGLALSGLVFVVALLLAGILLISISSSSGNSAPTYTPPTTATCDDGSTPSTQDGQAICNDGSIPS